MGFFKDVDRLLEENEPLSTLKTLISSKYSFQKLTQFSQGNNVLDAPASNIDSFLCRDICGSPTQLKRPIYNKEPISTLKKPELQEVFLSKTDSFLSGKQCARR
jgi:hypothetical protein